ncbi:hypothetical protein JCM8547_008392 [Rhodosporidiobolus lusitaniae]
MTVISSLSFPTKEVVSKEFPRPQTQPKLYPAAPSHPRLLHLPVLLPSASSSSSPSTLLTYWTTLTLPLRTLLSSLPPPAPRFSAVLGVEIHANCSVRRVWFSGEGMSGEAGEEEVRRGLRAEMALFAAAMPDEGEEDG